MSKYEITIKKLPDYNDPQIEFPIVFEVDHYTIESEKGIAITYPKGIAKYDSNGQIRIAIKCCSGCSSFEEFSTDISVGTEITHI